MAEKTTDWPALAKCLWKDAQVMGNGEYAVVARCHLPASVNLFESYDDAREFESKPCGVDCQRKHTYGNLTPYIPAPPPRKKTLRWRPEMQRD